ncbi:VOC family protein [Exiguobacterium alkaliphilum]|uniref:VOC family protein n=1 Tax=Exiguobacterium alkaliphilum TaxID=1428684 RepID=UPI0034642B97
MNIAHVAIWVNDLDVMRRFYETYFEAKANDLYQNEQNQFASYFLTFPQSDCRLELMRRADIQNPGQETLGYAHLAISLGSKEEVDEMTRRLVDDGYERLDGPRTTGDSYYESVILDPESNRIELTI